MLRIILIIVVALAVIVGLMQLTGRNPAGVLDSMRASGSEAVDATVDAAEAVVETGEIVVDEVVETVEEVVETVEEAVEEPADSETEPTPER